MNHDHYPESYIRDILKSVRTIAVLGASPNDARPSHGVMGFLLGKGYRVIPVNPVHAGKTILGQTVHARLADIPEPVDMVDVFRAANQLHAVVDEVLALRPCRRCCGASSPCATTPPPPGRRRPASGSSWTAAPSPNIRC